MLFLGAVAYLRLWPGVHRVRPEGVKGKEKYVHGRELTQSMGLAVGRPVQKPKVFLVDCVSNSHTKYATKKC